MEEKKQTLKDIVKESGINEKLNNLTTKQRKKIILIVFVIGLIILFSNILLTTCIRKNTTKESNLDLQVKQDSLEMLSNEIDSMCKQITMDTTYFDFQLQ